MAKRTQNVTIYTCDGCGKQAAELADPVLGLFGTVYEHYLEGGTGTANWYACQRSCIERAVLKALYPDDLERLLKEEEEIERRAKSK
jgi:hypothetical protein